MTHRLAEPLFDRGRRFLGCKVPILGGAMTWVSEPQLVAAICNADAFGCLAGGNSPPERLAAQILEGMEAGGHVGHVSLTVLLQQVLFQVQEVPVFVAGGVATGRMCAHLFLMGAAGVQIGTRFAIASESRAHPEFKRFMQRANARDAVATPQLDSRLPVVAVRALRNRGLADFNRLQLDLIRKLENGEIRREQAQEEVEKYWMGALRRAVVDGDVEHGSVMAGQSVGLVNQIQPVADIVADLVAHINEELERVRQLLLA